VKRRLAAILAADVAGYSRLMGANEEGTLEHVSAEQNRKVPGRIKGFPRGCLWVSLLALILFWRLSDAKFVFCRDARASHRKS
jgi:hypothetical protein